MFDNLTKRLTSIFDGLTRKEIITENDVEKAIREIRIALLEADIPLTVAKDLIERIKEKAVGEKTIKSVSPTDQIIKIVNDEIVIMLGGNPASEIKDPEEYFKTEEIFTFNKKGTHIILMAGLQGAGKTTSVGKLAKFIKEKYKKNPLLASVDIYRPAAQEQLHTLGQQIGVDVLQIENNEDVKSITKRALSQAKKDDYDVLIIDTAGRLQIDEKMMDEIKTVSKIAKPDDIFLTADAMLGQESINIAKAFKDAIQITGIVMTRLDSDARGGAALAMRYITGAPIKFAGVGEKLDDFEPFYPNRIASRILGMGDVVSLVEKAQDNIDEEEAKKMTEKMMDGKFDFNDMLSQIRQMKKMGSLKGILKMIPGISKMQDQLKKAGIDDNMVKTQEAVILSMTKKERENPNILLAGRKKRIAKGAGVSVKDVEKMIKHLNKIKSTMKQVKKMGGMEAVAEKMSEMQD